MLALLVASCASRIPTRIESPAHVAIAVRGFAFPAQVVAVAYEDGTVVRLERRSEYTVGALSSRDRDRVQALARSNAFSGKREIKIDPRVSGLADLASYAFAVRNAGRVWVDGAEFDLDDRGDSLLSIIRKETGDDIPGMYDLLVRSVLIGERRFVAASATFCSGEYGGREDLPLPKDCDWPAWLPGDSVQRITGRQLAELEDLLAKCKGQLRSLNPHSARRGGVLRSWITLRYDLPGSDDLLPWLDEPASVCGQ